MLELSSGHREALQFSLVLVKAIDADSEPHSLSHHSTSGKAASQWLGINPERLVCQCSLPHWSHKIYPVGFPWKRFSYDKQRSFRAWDNSEGAPVSRRPGHRWRVLWWACDTSSPHRASQPVRLPLKPFCIKSSSHFSFLIYHAEIGESPYSDTSSIPTLILDQRRKLSISYYLLCTQWAKPDF